MSEYTDQLYKTAQKHLSEVMTLFGDMRFVSDRCAIENKQLKFHLEGRQKVIKDERNRHQWLRLVDQRLRDGKAQFVIVLDCSLKEKCIGKNCPECKIRDSAISDYREYLLQKTKEAAEAAKEEGGT